MDYEKCKQALERINGTVLIAHMNDEDEFAFLKRSVFDKELYEEDYELLMQLVESIKPQRTQYQKIMDYFNENSGLPKIRSITNNRKVHLNARLKEHGQDSIYEVIDKCGKSDVLRYGFNGWRGADWDFLMKQDKYAMVLEGRYDNKVEEKKQGLDDFLKDVD